MWPLNSTSSTRTTSLPSTPPGGSDVEAQFHTVHTMVAVDDGGGRWRIQLLQATPAAWHQHPEARDALTEELRGLLAPQ